MDNHMVSGDTRDNTITVVVRMDRCEGATKVVGAFATRARAAAFVAKRNGERPSFLYAVLAVPLDSEDPDGLDASRAASREASYSDEPAPLPEGMREVTVNRERLWCTNTAIGEESDALDRPDGPGLSVLEAVYRGFPVAAKRVAESHWCGYLTVPKSHPWVQAACRAPDGNWTEPDENRLSLDVHGGCTYAELQKDGGLKVGFDCAHGSDGRPPWSQERSSLWGTYRDLGYVRAQLLSLAEQAEQAANR